MKMDVQEWVAVILMWCTVCIHGCPSGCQCTGSTWNSKVKCQSVLISNIMSNLPARPQVIEIISTPSTSLSAKDFNNSQTPGALQTLVIRDSYISVIEDNTFLKFSYVRNLTLSNNNLRIISKNAFSGMNVLEYLDLSNNNIQSIEEIFFPLRSLRRLHLNSNSLTAIPSGAFRAQTSLQILLLDSNELQSLIGQPFQGLTSLRELYMRNCELNSINILMNSVRNLYKLDMGANSINSLPSAVDFRTNLPNLKYLHLQGNKIIRLADNQFSGVSFDALDLSSNKLDQITSSMFQSFNVQELDLSNNAIIQVGDQAFGQLALRKLNLAFNPISTFSSAVFKDMYSLRELNLSACALKDIKDDQFRDFNYLQSLDISKNSLPYIPQEVIKKMGTLYSFVFSDNAWHCDCKIKPFQNWLKTVWKCNYMSNQFTPECQPPTCVSPVSLYQKQIQQLQDNDIPCDSVEETASSNVGTIVGLSVGSVILIVLLGVLIFVCCRRRQNTKQGGNFHLCRSPASDVTSHKEDLEKDAKPKIKPFNDGDQVSMQSDKSFVVRNYFQTMVSTDPNAISDPPERMRRDTFRTTYSGSNPSLASTAYSYPIGRETAI